MLTVAGTKSSRPSRQRSYAIVAMRRKVEAWTTTNFIELDQLLVVLGMFGGREEET